jgi:P-type Ca2+ transporter type 2C
VLLALMLYLPALQAPFGTRALSLTDWLVLLPLAGSVSVVLELAKWMERRGWFGATE